MVLISCCQISPQISSASYSPVVVRSSVGAQTSGGGGAMQSAISCKALYSGAAVEEGEVVEEGKRAASWATQFERLIHDKAGVATFTVGYVFCTTFSYLLNLVIRSIY